MEAPVYPPSWRIFNFDGKYIVSAWLNTKEKTKISSINKISSH